MCRKCIKSDVCVFKFKIGSALTPILKEKEGKKPEGMADGKAISLKEFQDVMDVVQEHCQFYVPIPEIKMADNIGEMEQ